MVNKELKLQSDLDTLSYCLGVSFTNNLKNQGVDTLKADIFAKAMEDVYAGKDTLLSMEEVGKWLNSYFQKLQEATQKQDAEKYQSNIEEGKVFLTENAKKEGVITLESGLQYKVLKEGTGAIPINSDKVKTHYHGTLIDGTVFDSSVERGEAISFPVNGVIKGWTEALQLMKVGAKWQLFIPHNLAYGERGAGNMIKPYSALIFEVELLAIEK